MTTYKYNRTDAVEYAEKWALSRNPAYYDFENLGGDCANFVSQSLYAGTKVMNYTPTYGWYYNSLNSRAPAWTSVEFLEKFLTTNTGVGPFGHVCGIDELVIGDVVFLATEQDYFHHSSVVTKLITPTYYGVLFLLIPSTHLIAYTRRIFN